MGQDRRQCVVEFFDQSYLWWEDVYEHRLPRGFLSFEMIRRKEAVLHMISTIARKQGRLRILECGCGPGGLLKDLSASEHLVCGLDINSRSLQLARAKCKTALLACGDIESLPFASGKFDIILCIGVLSYLSEDDAGIREMSRLLRPGGKLLIANPNIFMFDKLLDPYYLLVWPLKWLRQAFRPESPAQTKFTTGMIRRYRYGQLDRLFRDVGLTRTALIGTSYGPLRFWRRRCLSVARSIRISDALVRLSARPAFGFLPRLANHWVTCLERQV